MDQTASINPQLHSHLATPRWVVIAIDLDVLQISCSLLRFSPSQRSYCLLADKNLYPCEASQKQREGAIVYVVSLAAYA